MDEQLGRAQELRLIPPRPAGSVDATGLESSYVSRYFLRQQRGRCKRHRPWVKLTLLCEHRSHLISGLALGHGPSNDATFFPEVVRQSARRLRLDTLFGDGAYDAEPFHVLGREELGIRLTVFPVNRRGFTTPVRHGRYRRQMQRHFPGRRYGQRWQIESVVSQLKRCLRPELRARTEGGREREACLKVLTHNFMLLKRCA
jgi:hypothetical protein